MMLGSGSPARTCRPDGGPNAAAMVMSRTTPVIRDVIVPVAMRCTTADDGAVSLPSIIATSPRSTSLSKLRPRSGSPGHHRRSPPSPDFARDRRPVHRRVIQVHRHRRRLVSTIAASPDRVRQQQQRESATKAIATTHVAALAYALLRSVTGAGSPWGVPDQW